MLKIRLSRTGKNTQPTFRLIVQEHTAPIKGKFVEEIGYYRPTTPEKPFNINSERVKHWISVGARPSDTVATLLKKQGFEGMEKYMEPRDKKRAKKKAQPEGEAAPAAIATEPKEVKTEKSKETKPEESKTEEVKQPAEAKAAAGQSEAEASSEEKPEAKKEEPATAPENAKAEEAEAHTATEAPADAKAAKPEEAKAAESEEAKAEEAPAEAKATPAPAEESPKSES